MPTGTPFNACIPPYNIRVDDFASSTALEELGTTPALHLLTHTHSDHINGLSAKSFGHTVYCSQDAKEMLLRHEVFAERELHELELRAEKVRTYSHLKVDPLLFPDGTMYYTGSRDLLKTLPLHTPTTMDISGDEAVTITLLDANHCPGAVMFLIEGQRGAILHTGDFRAEPWFLDSIARNPFLQPYLYQGPDSGPFTICKTLEAIYLDTACVLSPLAVPTKACATSGLIELMKLFPSSVYFFINSWTWGYEDVLKAIAQSFQSKIHVDRYKYSIYQHLSDPFLRLITTRDSSSTRFHACERFHRCEYVMVDNEQDNYSNAVSHMGKRVIYVNPVTMGSVSWDLYLRDTKARLNAGEEINNLLVPLSRHSPLPELQAFVSLFRPRRVVPNTLDPRLRGLDWACIDRMFADHIHPSAATPFNPGRVSGGLSDILLPQAQDDSDVALKNLVGNGAADAAARWADGGKLLKKLDVVRSYLDAEQNALIDRLLGISKPAPLVRATSALTRQDKGKGKAIAPRYGRESDGDTDFSDSDDERGRTAHLLFASLAGIEEKENAWWVSSSPSQRASDADVLHEQSAPVAGPSSRKSGGGSGEPRSGEASRRKNRLLTPVSSPIRPRPMKPSPPQMKMKPLQPSPPVSTPHRFRKLSPIGRGYTLGSPIYILSSSPQAMHSSHGLPLGKGLASESSTKADKPSTSSSTRSLLTKTNSQIIHRQAPAVETTPATKKAGHKASRIELKPISHSPFFTPKKMEDLTSNKPATFTAEPKTPTKSSRKRVAHELPMEAVDSKRPRPDPPKARPSTPRAKNVASSSKKAAARGSSSSTRTPLPLSPVKVSSARRQRSELQLQRIRIGERLAQARPDLNAATYEKKRASLIARYSTIMEEVPQKEVQRGKCRERPLSLTPAPIRVLAQEKTILSFETVDDDDGGMDWNRSRELAARLKEDIANGRRPVLPALLCAESQSQDWESGSGS